MSKDVIVYYSKNGTTHETVEKIKQTAKKQVDIFDLNDKSAIDLTQYDRIFIGCGIYASNLQGKVSKFIKANSSVLKSKKVIFFIHGLISEASYKDAVENAAKNILPATSYEIHYLGGKLDISKQNFIVKNMLKAIAKQANIDPNNANTLMENRIADFLRCFSS